MTDSGLDFSFSPAAGRQQLLEDAAHRLDALDTHLGADSTGQPQSDLGDQVRAMMAEKASLPVFPEVYKISDKDYLARNLTAPLKFTQLCKDSRFYWIDFPVGLLAGHNWIFNKLEVKVEFSSPGPAHLAPKSYQILPDKKFQTLIQANQHLTVQFDENFELAAKTEPLGAAAGPLTGKLGGGVQGAFDGGFGLVLGPFEYAIKRAKIDHTATNLEWVFWRLDGAEYSQADSPTLAVVLKVPKETKNVLVKASVQAYRNFNFAAARFQQAVEELPRVLREYFKGGAPLWDQKEWDISPRL